MSESQDFAKLFGSGHDQIVVIRRAADETEEGEGVLSFYYDPRIDGLNISSIHLGFGTIETRDEAWQSASEERVTEFIASARNQLREAFQGRVVGKESGLLDAQGEPLYREANDAARPE